MDIHDTFLARGVQLDEFMEVVEELAEHTSVVEICTSTMELLPVLDKKRLMKEISWKAEKGSMEEEKWQEALKRPNVIYLGTVRDYFSKELPVLQALSMEQLMEKGGSKKLFQEAQRESRLFIRYEEQLYFTSAKMPESLCARIKMYGDAVYDTSMEWAAFVMHRLRQHPQVVKALVRTMPGTGVKKIMMLGSCHYQYIPQTFFRQTIHMLEALIGEKAVGRVWQVSAFVSTVCLEFPKLGETLRKTYQIGEELIPGICLTTSDTYDASLTARPLWRLKDAVIAGDGVMVEHDGKASVPLLHSRISAEIIDQYPKFLKRLKHFEEVEVINPEAVLSHLFSHLKIMKAIGKKRTLRVLSQCGTRFPDGRFSAYEMILSLIRLTEDETLPEFPSKKLKRAVYDAVYLEDKHYQRKSGGENPPARRKGEGK